MGQTKGKMFDLYGKIHEIILKNNLSISCKSSSFSHILGHSLSLSLFYSNIKIS